jgi:hypothetical protein
VTRRWREMDSNHRYRIRNTLFWLPPFGPAIRLPQQNRLFRAGDRWFESISLQRGVQCEPDRQAERGGGLMPGVQPGNQGASANNVRSIESAMAL